MCFGGDRNDSQRKRDRKDSEIPSADEYLAGQDAEDSQSSASYAADRYASFTRGDPPALTRAPTPRESVPSPTARPSCPTAITPQEFPQDMTSGRCPLIRRLNRRWGRGRRSKHLLEHRKSRKLPSVFIFCGLCVRALCLKLCLEALSLGLNHVPLILSDLLR